MVSTYIRSPGSRQAKVLFACKDRLTLKGNSVCLSQGDPGDPNVDLQKKISNLALLEPLDLVWFD